MERHAIDVPIWYSSKERVRTEHDVDYETDSTTSEGSAVETDEDAVTFRPAAKANVHQISYLLFMSRLPPLLRSICIHQKQNPFSYCHRHVSSQEKPETPAYTSDDLETFRRRRKTDWKRRQGGQSFLDNVIVTVRGGTGGSGCAAFHREKFKPFGPPSGGDGGRGGDVYILPTSTLTTLSTVPKKVRGENGAHGQGTWQNGKAGAPYVIKVPVGTVVRQLPWDDPRRAKDAWESEEESLQGLSPSEKREKMRDKRWVHYPEHHDVNIERDSFLEAEEAYYNSERVRRYESRRKAMEEPIYLDLDKEEIFEKPVNAPLGTRHRENLGHLVASGGLGGLGNPHFVSAENRSPKFATRGIEGERVTLSLELKLLADIGLVGMPNAGKSTLLRALTGGRAKSEVASYAFTTLNPVVGIVRVAEDGTFEGSISGQTVHEETWKEELEEQEKIERGDYAMSPTRNQITEELPANLTSPLKPGHHFDVFETFRFTIADNPGLISRASENVGLGHAFLRSMERSLALVYVVDFSMEKPWDELSVLRDELEKYQPGMSEKARLVLANKADLLASDGDPAAVEQAKEKLRVLEEYVTTSMTLPDGRLLDVVPISAKFSQNLRKVVGLMQKYVEEERDRMEEESEADPYSE
ncbi:putative GTP-binding protein P8A3.11c, mitochondrial [Psilocybe cubensis]|uniref:GTP-binding protein P8A3.11c, mitochondrial n=2 Tax=Psilocybe cubensis TaxID=181762 RepID=A0ACB8GGZ9_PSICU|nr:putative GTP-binding protein P8A3.11c, mitochondrial [Psilocybe cubensis]KAH9474762.1 putative GTP-binding protein P8A3.11c, mitochondrial [Psilocybe cubensis]